MQSLTQPCPIRRAGVVGSRWGLKVVRVQRDVVARVSIHLSFHRHSRRSPCRDHHPCRGHPSYLDRGHLGFGNGHGRACRSPSHDDHPCEESIRRRGHDEAGIRTDGEESGHVGEGGHRGHRVHHQTDRQDGHDQSRSAKKQTGECEPTVLCQILDVENDEPTVKC